MFHVGVPSEYSALRCVVHCFIKNSFKVQTEGTMRTLSYTNPRKLVLLKANFNLDDSEAVAALKRGVAYRNRPSPNSRISVLGYESVASVGQAEAGVDESEDEVDEDLDAAAAAEKLRVSLDWFVSVDSNSAYADIRRRLKANHDTVLYSRKELSVVDNFGEVEVERIIAHPRAINKVRFGGENCLEIRGDSDDVVTSLRADLEALKASGDIVTFSTTESGSNVLFNIACASATAAMNCRSRFKLRQRISRVR